MEIIPAYQSLVRVAKSHGLTEYSHEYMGDINSPAVDQFLSCRDVRWRDPRGGNGYLRLTATPSPKGGLVELSMTLTGVPGSVPLQACFRISPDEIVTQKMKLNRNHQWVQDGDPSSGMSYQEHLLATADILSKNFRNGQN